MKTAEFRSNRVPTLKAAGKPDRPALVVRAMARVWRQAGVARILSLLAAALAVLCLAGCGSTLVTSPGTGVFLVTPANASFGTVDVGQHASLNISLVNRTLSSVQISELNVAGTGFSLVNPASLPVTVASGATYVFAVQFAPAAVGSDTGQVTVAANAEAASPTEVSLSGTGAEPSTATLSALSCATGSYSAAGSDACTVTLSAAAPAGGTAVSLSSNQAAVVVPFSVTVAAGATTASFTATVSAVTASETATLTATAGSATATTTLQLTATAATAGAQLGINATSLSYGDVLANTSATQSVTLSSAGGAAVTISAVTLTGTGFRVTSGTFPATLGVGQTAAVNVEFAPTTAGAATGTLTVVSDSMTNPTAQVALSGTGVTQAVALTWDAPSSSDDPVANYHIYRAVNGSAAYALLSSTAESLTDYTDASAQSGTTYEYYVTSVDGAGDESVPSNVATVAVP